MKNGILRPLLSALCALALGTSAAGAGENAGSHAGFERERAQRGEKRAQESVLHRGPAVL